MKWDDARQSIQQEKIDAKNLRGGGNKAEKSGFYKPLFKTEEDEQVQVRLWLDMLNDGAFEPERIRDQIAPGANYKKRLAEKHMQMKQLQDRFADTVETENQKKWQIQKKVKTDMNVNRQTFHAKEKAVTGKPPKGASKLNQSLREIAESRQSTRRTLKPPK